MKLSKVAFAVATLAIATGSAFAGQIDSSSATLAIEAIKTDLQTVRAPSKSYSFAGDIDARTNEQRLQLQYTLSKGTWAVGATEQILTVGTLTPIAVDSILTLTATNGAGVNIPNMAGVGTVIDIQAFVTADKKTLVFNLTIPALAGPNNFLKQPQFTVNPGALVAGNAAGTPDNIGVNGLFTVAGVAACPAPDQNADINFKHFTNHAGSATLQANASPDSEHLRAGSTNDARLLNFTQNLIFNFTPAANSSRTDAAVLNTLFTPTSGLSNFAGTPAPVLALAATNRHYIGRVNLKLRSNGLDLNYGKTYGNFDNAPATFLAPDFEDVNDTGSLDAGEIEMKEYTHELTVPANWPAGTIVTGYDVLGAPISATIPSIPGQTVYTLNSILAVDAARLASSVYLIAQFPGAGLIPQTGAISVKASITKDTLAGAPDRREQDNVCVGALTGIGGGIKIDIRNYASKAKFPAGNFASYVRLINNSESQTADVFAQLIYADGKYGPWGALPALLPRAVANYSNAQLEALLTNAAPVVNPFGTATQYTSDQSTSVLGTGAAGIGDRVRFVSNTGTTIRVQSFMLLPTGNLLDTTNAQGVDFENTTNNRVPTGYEDAQPISQDAINGLAK